MRAGEFKREFDIVWNSIMSNQAPSLSGYEMSIFLTQGQETVVKGIYNGTLTHPFESTEDARSYLTPLVIQGYPTKLTGDYPHITKGSLLYDLDDIHSSTDPNPDNKLPGIWFITYEGVEFKDNNSCDCESKEGIVKPVTQDTFWEIKRNPFKKQNNRRVLRLTLNDKETNIAELVSDYSLKSYFIRYIRKPKPIIVDDLTTYGPDITIDGATKPYGMTTSINDAECCELNTNLHRVILETAVKLAQQSWYLTREQKKSE